MPTDYPEQTSDAGEITADPHLQLPLTPLPDTGEATVDSHLQLPLTPLPDAEQTDDSLPPIMPVTGVIDTSIDAESSSLQAEREQEPAQTGLETPQPPALDPLPDMEETIVLSPRARRILLYMASRSTRPAHMVSQPTLSAANPTNSPDMTSLSQETLDVAAPVAQESAPEMATLPTKPLAPTEPVGQDMPTEIACIPVAKFAPDDALELAPTTPRIKAMPSVLPPIKMLIPQPALPNDLSSPLARFERRRDTSLIDPQHRKHIARLQYFSRKHLRRARVNDSRASRSLWTKIWIATSTFLMIFLIVGAVVAYVANQFINTTQGTYANKVLYLRDLVPPDNLKIYDNQGTLIDQMTDQGAHTTVKYAQVAPDLVNATVAIEDRTFWKNTGFDLTGILRSATADAQNTGQIQGGSTITQQLIKQLIVGDAPDIIRKLSELALAPQVNNHYSKRDIMEMYLNTIYYGYQAYGIDAAATTYFGLDDKPDKSAASQLDLAQSVLLAGLPRNASLYDPLNHPKTSAKRFQEVLNAMVQQGYITQIQAQDAYQEAQSPTFFKSSPTLQDQAPHFDEYVLSQLEQTYHLTRSQLSRSGLIVTTTLNLALQQQILPIMQRDIAAIPAFHKVSNAAEVLIDFHTGAIISMLGSIDYNNKVIDGQYNVALAYRQPGSSFKPYVYVTAFAQGASPGQAIDDVRTSFSNPGGTPNPYVPNNYSLTFQGHMTLRCALQNSLNVPAVKVLQHAGINNALQTAQAMGISTYEGTPGLGMVLGSLDVRLLDHTSAYGVFANAGVREPYYSISKIVQGTTGKVLFQHQLAPGVQIITPQLAYIITNILSDNTSRLPEFFDCNNLQLFSNSVQDCRRGNRGAVRPAAAKTGTTQDFRDNLTMGYTTDYVMGVWAGNDNNAPMVNITGVDGAAPIWHDAMLLVEQGHPIRDFQNPGGLIRATVTYPDGVTSTDLYLPGTVPASVLPPIPTPSGTPVPPTVSFSVPISDAGGTPRPFCSTYSFAFAPPSANGNWW
ncbi:MAG: transglycosylase domain-containing protein [Ktedonobacteraceae bacterium]